MVELLKSRIEDASRMMREKKSILDGIKRENVRNERKKRRPLYLSKLVG